MLSLEVQHSDGRPRWNCNRLTYIIDSDENDWALGGLNRVHTSRVAGVDGDEDMHAAVARIDEASVYLDQFADTDGPVEVEVAYRYGQAAAPAPPGGGGMGRSVYPLE
jgi:hypothetical protein